MEIPHPTTNKKQFVLKCNKNIQKVIKETERGLKKGPVYSVAQSTGASVPGVTAATLDPLGPAMDGSLNNVRITDYTIISSRSGRSP